MMGKKEDGQDDDVVVVYTRVFIIECLARMVSAQINNIWINEMPLELRQNVQLALTNVSIDKSRTVEYSNSLIQDMVDAIKILPTMNFLKAVSRSCSSLANISSYVGTIRVTQRSNMRTQSHNKLQTWSSIKPKRLTRNCKMIQRSATISHNKLKFSSNKLKLPNRLLKNIPLLKASFYVN